MTGDGGAAAVTGDDGAVVELAGYADEYRTRVFDDVLTEFDLDRERLLDVGPNRSLQFFFRRYGFERAGTTRTRYQKGAVRALERTTDGEDVDPERLRKQFVRECERTGIGVVERTYRDVVAGMARLVEREGNPFRWVGREVNDHYRLTVLYDELVAIDGIGPNAATAFLRDAVWVCDVENRVRAPDRHYLQSMTGRVAAVVESLWPGLEGADEDVLADHVVTACSEAGASGVAFNQGAWYAAREFDGDVDDL